MEIIILVLCAVNLVLSIFTIIYLIAGGKHKDRSSKEDSIKTIYCPNCCQPFESNLKSCPNCGQIKNK